MIHGRLPVSHLPIPFINSISLMCIRGIILGLGLLVE